MNTDKIRGALLGTAVGDALGMPIEGMSHQNVRTYYKGIKEYRADEKRNDLGAGQWTDDTQMTFAVARTLANANDPSRWPSLLASEYVNLLPTARRWGLTSRRAIEQLAEDHSSDGHPRNGAPTDGAAMRAAPLGVWWALTGASRHTALPAVRSVLALTHSHPDALAAGVGQAFAIRYAIEHSLETFQSDSFWKALLTCTAWAEGKLNSSSCLCSERLRLLSGHLHQGIMPLDLQDLCDGTGYYAHEAWPFSVAMFARAPHLIEATMLSTVNVGGDADTTGAMTGALLGALNGWESFPAAWRNKLEDVDDLLQQADAFEQAFLHT